MSESARIASLETQVRILKRMLFGVFGLVVAGTVLGATSLQTVPDVIQAKRFEVVDDTGSVFVKLSLVKEPDSPKAMNGIVEVYEASKKSPIIDMGSTVAGNGMLTLSSPDRGFENRYRDSVTLAVDELGYGVLSFINEKNSNSLMLFDSPDGGVLRISDKTGVDRMLLGSFPTGPGLAITGTVQDVPVFQLGALMDDGYLLARSASGEIYGYIGPQKTNDTQDQSSESD